MSISTLIRLFFIALVLAAKFNDDLRLSNGDFSKIGGVSVGELILLEIHFLKVIEFNLNVSLSTYVSYLKNILS